MRQVGALWGPSPGQEDMEALELLEESQRLLSGILLGVILQMRSLELARLELLGAGEPGEAGRIEGLQLSASALSVWALMGFWRQALEVGSDQDLGAASLAIGLIRLMKLLCPGAREGAAQEVVELSEPLE